jgi:hypothetical protein
LKPHLLSLISNYHSNRSCSGPTAARSGPYFMSWTPSRANQRRGCWLSTLVEQ